MTKTASLLAAVALLAVASSVAVAAPPPLTKAQATTEAQQAVKSALWTTIGRRQITCASRGAMKQVCAVRWSSGLRRTTGTVTITRSGVDASPVDRYRIAIAERGKYSPTRRAVKTGRFVAETRRAALGQPLQLLSSDDGEAQITPGAYVDPYTPANEYDTPSDGTRYVAVPVTVRNVGEVRYELGGARLITTAGVALDPAYASGCDRPSDMAPGETRVGCLAFEVPFGTVIQQLEIPGEETGVWR